MRLLLTSLLLSPLIAIGADEANVRLVQDKTVRLVKDTSETDRYGRLLDIGEGSTIPFFAVLCVGALMISCAAFVVDRPIPPTSKA